MKELYKEQLKKILDLHYRRKKDDINELSWAIKKIETVSKDNAYKKINLELAKNKLRELTA